MCLLNTHLKLKMVKIRLNCFEFPLDMQRCTKSKGERRKKTNADDVKYFLLSFVSFLSITRHVLSTAKKNSQKSAALAHCVLFNLPFPSPFHPLVYFSTSIVCLFNLFSALPLSCLLLRSSPLRNLFRIFLFCCFSCRYFLLA